MLYFWGNGAGGKADYEQLMALSQDSICTELVRRLQQHKASLLRATGVAAETDCLLALANAAAQFNLCKPKLSVENRLTVRQGMHRALV